MRPLYILAITIALAACSQETNAPVARVDEVPISGESLRSFVEKLPPGLRNPEGGDAARRQYVQSLIDRQLILKEALVHGLDTLQSVKRTVDEAVDARVIALYRARNITAQVQVPEEDVRRVFAEEGYHRERKLNAILVHTRAEIEAAVAALAAGQPFAEVARSHSLDKRSAEQGGELGFIGREAAPSLHVPAEVFNTLPLGEISAPLRAGLSWHIVRFTEDRDTPYERYRPLIEELLFSERLGQVEAEHFESLRAAAGAALDRDGLQLMLRAAQREDVALLDTCTAPLYTFAEGQATVASAYKALRRLNAQRSLKDSSRARTALDRLVLRPLLQRRAAREQDLYDDPDIQRLAKRAYQDALLNAVRERFAAIEMLSDAEVWSYYDSHPDMFYHEESVEVEELLASSPAEAQWLSDQLAAGASFADLADRSVRAQAVQSQARFHFHPRDEKLYPRLVPAIYAAEPGQLVGPIRVRDGYSIFRVQGRNPGRVEPYEQVQRRARALLRRERENAAFTSFVQDLRQRYQSRVEIDERALKVALPDSLVQGT